MDWKYELKLGPEAVWVAVVAAIIAIAAVAAEADFSNGWTWVPIAAGAAGRAALGAILSVLSKEAPS